MVLVLNYSKKKNENKVKSPLAENLYLLLKKERITEAELSRKSGVSQQQCNHILTGRTLNPQIDTIVKLSNFFNVTVGQLIGAEPINIQGKTASFSLIPILSGKSIVSWVHQGELPISQTNLSWVSCDIEPGFRAYAIRIDASHEPLYEENSTLIVKLNKCYTIGSHVVVSFDGFSISIRSYAIEEGNIYLLPVLKGQPKKKYEPSYLLLGTVIETRVFSKQ